MRWRPLVSVITPTLNHARYIEATLESVAAQSYGPIEHIVVDGGSDDGTLKILDRWGRERDVRWVSGPDSGMYSAVNKGLALATGDVLAYLNSDDGWFPWAVEAAVSALAAEPAAGYVFGDVLNIDDVTGAGTIGFYPQLPKSTFQRAGRLGQPAVFWRRTALDAVGSLDENLRYGADTEFFMRLARRFSGVRIDEVLAWEREYPQRASQAMGMLLAEEIAAVRRRHSVGAETYGRVTRVRDQLSVSMRHRALALAFIAAAGPTGVSATRWSRIRGDADFVVDRPRLAASLVPGIGRRYLRYVHCAPDRMHRHE